MPITAAEMLPWIETLLGRRGALPLSGRLPGRDSSPGFPVRRAGGDYRAGAAETSMRNRERLSARGTSAWAR